MNRWSATRRAAALGLAVALFAAAPRTVAAAGVYFVKDGDTLNGIARVFRVGVADIQALNRLSGTTIRPGDRLRIPDARPGAFEAAAHATNAPPPADRVLRAVCRDETVYHTVAKGDTLFAIARRYGAGVDDLLRLNGLRSKSRLAIGQRLVVRRSGPRTHVVAQGETLHRLATRFRVPVADLVRLNQLDGDTIVAGQLLQIEPCDPYAAAGTAPPPLAEPTGPDDGLPFAALSAPAADAGPAEPEAAAATDASPTDRLIRLAKTLLGIPYRFGGTTLRGIDCSGYVQRVFTMLDVKLPRTAREQFGVGTRVGRDELAVGDLVFFRTYASFPSHVGIYLGDNLFIHASSVVRKVTIDRLDVPYYRKRFLGARRLVAGGTLAAAP